MAAVVVVAVAAAAPDRGVAVAVAVPDRGVAVAVAVPDRGVAAGGGPATSLTRWFSRSRLAPAVTSCSPPARPSRISMLSSPSRPVVTEREATAPSGVTSQTLGCPSRLNSAVSGTRIRSSPTDEPWTVALIP